MLDTPMLELDGRTLEGGCQLLRLAIGLSALNGTPIKISHIRGNRSSGGGLRSQHLACVNWLTKACDAEVLGAEKGSKELIFQPRPSKGKSSVYRKVAKTGGRHVWKATLDIQTAGSTGLGLQAILPFILFAPPREDNGEISSSPLYLTLRGGTNVSASPSYDYITQVLLPTLASIGLPSITPVLHKRGWSHGGTTIGSLTLEVPPRQSLSLPAFSLYPANPTQPPVRLSHVRATFIAPTALHKDLRARLPGRIQDLFGPIYSTSASTLEINCEDSQHPKRFYLLLVATMPAAPSSPSSKTEIPPDPYILARDGLYDRKMRLEDQAERIWKFAEEVTADLHTEWASGAWVDEHVRDQLVVYQALAKRGSRVWGGWEEGKDGEEREPSLHAKTAEWVVQKVLGRGNEEGGKEKEDALGMDSEGFARQLAGLSI